MIQLMRSRAASWVAKILAVFLIVSFGVWGIGDMFRGGGVSDVVASVDSTDISRNDFRIQFTRLMNAMRSRLGADFNTQQAAQLGLVDQTLDQMINARLMLIEARHLGLDAGEGLIRQTIFNDKRFQGVDERFDKNRFQMFLTQEGMPEGAYVATLRENIIRNQVAGALSATTTVPKVMLDTLFRYHFEKRVADVATVPLGKADDIRNPSDSELAAFHKDNPGLFTAPEYRKIVAIYLDPDEMAKSLSPSEDRIRQEFEYRKATLTVPERRTIEQVLLTDQKKAEALSKQLEQGRPFKKAVEDATGKPPVLLGTLAKRDLPNKALADAAFALPKGGTSKPVKSVLGWHILHVTAITPGKEPTLKEYHKEIRADVAREMAVDDIIKLTGKLDDALGSGAPLEEAAPTIGAQVLTIDAVDANGLGPSGKPVKNLPASPLFLQKAFDTAEGETTNIEEGRNGAYFVLRVDKVTPPALRPLKDVRAEAIADWKKDRVRDAAKEKAEKLQKAAKAVSSLAKAAKDAGYKVVTSEPFTRFDQPSGSPVSPQMATSLFNAKPNEPVVVPTQSGYAVATVTKVIEADPNKDKEDTKDLKDQLEQSLATDAISQFLAALRKKYPVKIDHEAVDSVVGLNSGG